jgi:hypothetical protein
VRNLLPLLSRENLPYLNFNTLPVPDKGSPHNRWVGHPFLAAAPRRRRWILPQPNKNAGPPGGQEYHGGIAIQHGHATACPR